MKRTHRPKFSIKQTVNGFRFHVQFEDASTLIALLDETVMQAPFRRSSTKEKCVDACIAEIYMKLITATKIVRKEFCFKLSIAQSFALHHALKNEIIANNVMENVVKVTTLLELDKLIA